MRDRRRIVRSFKAVSNVVGEVILIAISLSMAFGLAMYIYSLFPTQKQSVVTYNVDVEMVPNVVNGTIQNYTIIVKRISGDLLPPVQYLVATFNGSRIYPVKYVNGTLLEYVVSKNLTPGVPYKFMLVDELHNRLIVDQSLEVPQVLYYSGLVGPGYVDIAFISLAPYNPSTGQDWIYAGEPLAANLTLLVYRGSSNITNLTMTLHFGYSYFSGIINTYYNSIVLDSIKSSYAITGTWNSTSQTLYLNLSAVPSNVLVIKYIYLTFTIYDTGGMAPGSYYLTSVLGSSIPQDVYSPNNVASGKFYVYANGTANVTAVNLAITDVELKAKVLPPGGSLEGTIQVANLGSVNVTSFPLRIELIDPVTHALIKEVDYTIQVSDYIPSGVLAANQYMTLTIQDLEGINPVTGAVEYGFTLPTNLTGKGYTVKFEIPIPNDVDYTNNVWTEEIFLRPSVLVLGLDYPSLIYSSLEGTPTEIPSTSMFNDSSLITFLLQDVGYNYTYLDAEAPEFNGLTLSQFLTSITTSAEINLTATEWHKEYQLIIVDTGIMDSWYGVGSDLATLLGGITNLNTFFAILDKYVDEGGYVWLLGANWDSVFSSTTFASAPYLATFFEEYLGVTFNWSNYTTNYANLLGGTPTQVASGELYGTTLPQWYGQRWMVDSADIPGNAGVVDLLEVLYGKGVIYTSFGPSDGYVGVVNATQFVNSTGVLVRPKVAFFGAPVGILVQPPERNDIIMRFLAWFFPQKYEIYLNMIWLNIAYESETFAFEMPVFVENMGYSGVRTMVTVSLVQKSTGYPLYTESKEVYLGPYGQALEYFQLVKVVTGSAIANMFARHDIQFTVYAIPVPGTAREADLYDNVYVMPFFDDADYSTISQSYLPYVGSEYEAPSTTSVYSFASPSAINYELGTPDWAYYTYPGLFSYSFWSFTFTSYYGWYLKYYVGQAFYSSIGSNAFAINYTYYTEGVLTYLEPGYHYVMAFGNGTSSSTGLLYLLPINLSQARSAYLITLEYSAHLTYDPLTSTGMVGAVVWTTTPGAAVSIVYNQAPAVGYSFGPLGGVRIGVGNTTSYVYVANYLWSGRAMVLYDLSNAVGNSTVYVFFDVYLPIGGASYEDGWTLDNLALVYRPSNPLSIIPLPYVTPRR